MYSASAYDVMKNVCKTRKFVMAILHWKGGLLCDKSKSDMFNILSNKKLWEIRRVSW